MKTSKVPVPELIKMIGVCIRNNQWKVNEYVFICSNNQWKDNCCR